MTVGMNDPMEQQACREAVTKSEVALENIVRTMMRSGYEAAQKGLDLDEAVGQTLVDAHPHLASVAATIRSLGVSEHRLQQIIDRRAEQDVILNQIQEG